MTSENHEHLRTAVRLRRLTLQRKDLVRVHAHEIEALIEEVDALRAQVAMLSGEVEQWRCLMARAMEHAAEHHGEVWVEDDE